MDERQKLVYSFSNLNLAAAQVKNLKHIVNKSHLDKKNKMLDLLKEAEESLDKISSYYKKQLQQAS